MWENIVRTLMFTHHRMHALDLLPCVALQFMEIPGSATHTFQWYDSIINHLSFSGLNLIFRQLVNQRLNYENLALSQFGIITTRVSLWCFTHQTVNKIVTNYIDPSSIWRVLIFFIYFFFISREITVKLQCIFIFKSLLLTQVCLSNLFNYEFLIRS